MLQRRITAILALSCLIGCVIEPGTPPSQQAAGKGGVHGKVVLTGVSDASGISVIVSQSTAHAAVTAADGTYDVSGLPAGNYSVTAIAKSTLEGTLSTTVTVSTQVATVQDLVFTPTGSVTGTATLGAPTGNAGIVVATVGTSAIGVTDDAGHFTLANVPIGMRQLAASYAGYTSAASSALTVTYNSTVTAPALTLTKAVGGGSLSGKIILTGQDSSPGIAVTLSGPTGAATQTDASGAYQFTALPTGMYTLTAVAPSTLELTQVVQVSVGQEPATAPTMTFTPLGTVTGTATLGNTTGNAGIAVAVAGGSAVTVTDDSGHYTLRGAPAGAQTIIASLPGYASATVASVMVPYASTVTAPALTLTKATAGAGAITGFVRLPGVTNLGGFLVTLAGTTSGATVTDATGAYSFQGLPMGSYAITAAVPSTVEGSQTVQAVVAQATVSAPDLAFTPAGSITGTATLGSATGNAGILIALAGSAAFATTDDAGHYALKGVPVGAQTLIASMQGYGSVSASNVEVSYDMSTQAPALTLTAGQTMLAGAIQGTVHLGTPAGTNIAVTLTGPVSGAAVTDSSGSYSFTGLPPGTYTVTAAAPSTVEGSVTIPVMVAQAALTAPDLTFTPVGTIVGMVTLGASTGNAGITVAAAGTSILAVTDDGGNFALKGVPMGSRTIVASMSGYAGASQTVQVAYATSVTAPTVVLKRAAGTGGVQGTAVLTGLSSNGGIAITLTGPISGATTTNGLGAYSFSGLPAGTYTITAAAPSTLESIATTQVTVATSVVNATGLAFTPIGSITGTATLGSSTGNGGIVVTATGSAAVAATDDAGKFTLRRVPVGSRTVTASYSGYSSGSDANVMVAYASTVTVPTLSLMMVPNSGSSATVSGVATMLGATDNSGTTVTLTGSSASATTASDGSFAVTNVSPAFLTLQFSNGAYQESVPNVLALPGAAATLLQGGVLYPLASNPIDIPRGTRLVSNTTAFPWVSADGSLGASVNGSTLAVFSLSTGHTTATATLPTNTKLAYLRFTPDNSHIAYTTVTATGSTVVTLYVLPTAGGTPAVIGSLDFSLFLVSPDSSKLVFWVLSGNNTTLTTYSISSGATTNLTTLTGPSYYPSGIQEISPDGSRVIYGYSQGWTASIAITGGTPITTNTTNCAFSPDLAYCYYLNNYGNGVSWTSLTTGAQGTVYSAASGTSIFGPLGIAPSGGRLFFATKSNSTSQYAPATIKTDGTGFMQLQALNSDQPYYASFSGDSNAVVWHTYPTGAISTFGAPVDGSTQAKLFNTTANTAIVGPIHFAGTSHVFTLGTYTSSGILQAMDAIAGSTTTLATNIVNDGSLNALPSSDGSLVVYRGSMSGGDAIFSVPISGGTPKPLLRIYDPGMTWLPFSWLTSNSILAIREGTPAPYAFQDGLYSVPVP